MLIPFLLDFGSDKDSSDFYFYQHRILRWQQQINTINSTKRNLFSPPKKQNEKHFLLLQFFCQLLKNYVAKKIYFSTFFFCKGHNNKKLVCFSLVLSTFLNKFTLNILFFKQKFHFENVK